jgi:hypothetical protein
MKFDCKMCPIHLKYNWNSGCSIIIEPTKKLRKVIEHIVTNFILIIGLSNTFAFSTNTYYALFNSNVLIVPQCGNV